MGRLFISYSHQDSSFSNRLRQSLIELGADIWIDVHDIRLGSFWSEEIRKALDQCELMLLVLSSDAVASAYVSSEWQYFLSQNKPIAPLLWKPSSLPPELAMIQHVDFYSQDYHTALTRLYEELKSRGISLRLPSSESIFSQLLKWIDIPFNQANLKGNQNFKISKYPITNQVYAKFIAEDGYLNRNYWGESWELKEIRHWVCPRYWQDKNWNQPNHPVVGVSLFEAKAFTRWLVALTGEDIRLPTSEKWEHAARGNTELPYPWGNKFGNEYCNIDFPPVFDSVVVGMAGMTPIVSQVLKHSPARRTTEVTRYEGKGDSVFGVVDMIGNVWEWCNTQYLLPDFYVLHGGAWNTKPRNVGISIYRRVPPDFRSVTVGFRIVCNLGDK